jgi:hypothetical protein
VCLKGKLIKLGSQVSTNGGGGFRPEERRSSETRAYKLPSHDRPTSKLLNSKTSVTQVHSTSPYFHHNNNSNSNVAKKKKKSDKIFEISKPTKFEHGIHVEYSNESGKFLVSINN